MPLILIASQDPETRLTIRDMLLNDSDEVIEAESGEGCLTTVRQMLPHLILLDLQLPPVEEETVGARLRTLYVCGRGF
jgi:CheY-like chemotaxis protein